jgi:hypothetical protein
MFDEKGNEIDLDSVDAIGELPDGRFEIWLANDQRVITVQPGAFELWKDHIRSKMSAPFQMPDRMRSAAS